MPEQRPRNIANLKVVLGGNVSVCEWPSVSVKDLYRQIFNQSAKYESYESAKANGLWYFEDTLAVLDNWVILKYDAQPFLSSSLTSNPSGFPDAKDCITINTTNISGYSSNTYSLAKNQPWSVDLNILPMDSQNTKKVQSLIVKDGDKVQKAETAQAIVDHFGLDGIFTTILKDTDVTSPKIVFNVGQYYYVFDRNSANLLIYKTVEGIELIKTIYTGYSLKSGGKNQSTDSTTPKNNRLYTLMFYPLSTKLYIGCGSIDPWKAGNDYVSFSGYVNIPAGNLGVTVYGATAAFTVNKLIHEESGRFSRPNVEVNNPGGATFKTALLGQKSNKALTQLSSVTSTRSVTLEYPTGSSETFNDNFKYLNKKVSYIFSPIRGGGKRSKIAWSYDVTLNSTDDRYYSPTICRSELYISPYINSVGQRSRDVSTYVLNASVTLTGEQSSATVVLTNRDMATENLSTSVFDDEYLIWGIRPIQINASYDSTELNNDAKSLVFKGYTNGEPKMEKTKDTATITLTCFDASQRARETYGINLPIYDGWCHLAVMRNLMQEAGYTSADSTILPVEPNQSCYDGHVTYLPDERWHFLMPFHIGENPGYMFSMGTPIWDCMNTIKGISNWYLYGRYDGKLVYAPPYKLFQSYGNRFKEVPTIVGNFDEIRRNLRMDVSFSNFRNAVYRSGVVVQAYDKYNVDTQPVITIMKQKGWPNSIVSTRTFVPWLRWDASHDPSMNDTATIKRAAIAAAKLNSRERRNVSFACWGKRVFPYEIIKIEENVKAETFVNLTTGTESYIVTAVSHNFSNGCLWDTSLECELYDKAAFILYGSDVSGDFTEV